jgi:RHS repeat-associated protein
MTQLGLTIPAGFDPEVAALAAYAGTLDPNSGTQTEQVISGVLLQLDDDLDMGVIDPYVIPPSIDSLDLFAMELYYASSNTAIQSEPQFNGNISQIVWQAAGRHKQSYGYQYDGLNRLTKATYADLLCTAPNTGCVYVTNDHYSEPLISYDQMGNITRLQRYGVEKKEAPRGYCYDELMIDDLFYSYDGNRLIALSDYTAHGNGFTDGTTTTQEYAYDANGNMISDQNKGITSITYNHLNLPKKIIFATGAMIEILYDAAGGKLRKKTTAPDATITTTDYCGGIEYVNGEFISVYHSEGRVEVYETQENIHAPVVKRYRHEYVLRDHLGNTRVTFSDLNGDNVIQPLAEKTQENNYYSFGMNMEGPWSGAASGYKYQYNGKELNDDFGLDWNDYGARWYDAAIGRWWVVDPMVQLYIEWSPYNFTLCNPIKYTDPDGNIIVDQNGNIVVTTNYNSTGQQRQLLVEEKLKSSMTAEGYIRSAQVNAIYNDVTIYADNGTAIQALQFVSATQIVTITDGSGNIIDQFETPVSRNIDCTSNCHGFTFVKGQLVINPDQAQILLLNDDYQNTDKTNAQVVVLNDANGEPQHSGIVNSDGTFNDKGGLGKPQFQIGLDKVQAGIEYLPPEVYMSKKTPNSILNTTLGTEKNGVRTISKPAEIKKIY